MTLKNDGSVREGVQGVTTSMDLAKQLDKKVVKAALSANVDGEIWDLTRPLERDCTLEILSWQDAKGKDVRFPPPPSRGPCTLGGHCKTGKALQHICKNSHSGVCSADLCHVLQTFWHSSSHVLGEALESLYGVRLTIGPAVEEGFYYDCYYGSKTLSDADKPAIEKKINEVRGLCDPDRALEGWNLSWGACCCLPCVKVCHSNVPTNNLAILGCICCPRGPLL